MPASKAQSLAVGHVKEFLRQRGYQIAPRKITLEDGQVWQVFEWRRRQLGVDPASGLWVRGHENEEWRCVCMPCSVGGAVEAIEFLITG